MISLTEKLDPINSIRRDIGIRRGVRFIELLIEGDLEHLYDFKGKHLTPGKCTDGKYRENYGITSEAFNQYVGETLAEIYIEHDPGNVRNFFRKDFGSPVKKLSQEIMDAFHSKLKEHYHQ